MDDDTVYLIYHPDTNDLPTSLLWLGKDERGEDVLCEEWYDMTGRRQAASITYDILDVEMVVPHFGPNYSTLEWPRCCECNAVSFLDFLCPECRDE